MDTPQHTDGDRPVPDLVDRLLELRNDHQSYSECALVLAREGYVNPSGKPYTSQGLQKRIRPYEGPGAVVHTGGDDESQLELFFQVMLVGSRNEGRSGEIFKASLEAWNAAIATNKGRWQAAVDALEVAHQMRKARVKK